MHRTEKLYIGSRLRRFRQSLGMAQGKMALELGISPSYLNLIERDQRPVSAKVLLDLVDLYKFDLSGISGAEEAQLKADILDIMKDPVFSKFALSKPDIDDVINMNPEFLKAFQHLYERHSELKLSTISKDISQTDREQIEILEGPNPIIETVRRFIHSAQNYFDVLDRAAEDLYKQLMTSEDDIFHGLKKHLKNKHELRVGILPADIMPDRFRFFDRHNKIIRLSELLPVSGRIFQLAYQIGLLEHRSLIEQHIEAGQFDSEEAKGLCRANLANYFAGAVLMPYSQFLLEAEKNRYDIELLMSRFGTSFEQTAHRLTTLQRPEARGVPFFFIRIDAAGNVSKRFSSGKFHFSSFGGACPLWNIHACFQVPGKIQTQLVQLPDEHIYFSIARTVKRGAGTFNHPAQMLAVGLGCDITQAHRLIYSRNYNLTAPRPTPIGVNCYLCERPACRHRAQAPLNANINFDDRTRGVSMIRFHDSNST